MAMSMEHVFIGGGVSIRKLCCWCIEKKLEKKEKVIEKIAFNVRNCPCS